LPADLKMTDGAPRVPSDEVEPGRLDFGARPEHRPAYQRAETQQTDQGEKAQGLSWSVKEDTERQHKKTEASSIPL
jgi:hypothetical protein